MQRIAGSGHNLDLDKGAALINAMAAFPQVTGDKRTTGAVMPSPLMLMVAHCGQGGTGRQRV